MHIRFTVISKYLVPLSTFVFLSLTFEILVLQLEIGIKSNALHIESNTKRYVVEIQK